VWSPDGSKLAFIAGDVPITSDVPNAGVYVANADGSGFQGPISDPEDLDDISVDHGLAWLPGTRDEVVYYGPAGAFLSSINGVRHRLPNKKAYGAAEPSPDGKKILYVEASSSGSAIAVASIAGGPAHRLTQK
jgi:Tol biopolymer transport system component